MYLNLNEIKIDTQFRRQPNDAVMVLINNKITFAAATTDKSAKRVGTLYEDAGGNWFITPDDYDAAWLNATGINQWERVEGKAAQERKRIYGTVYPD